MSGKFETACQPNPKCTQTRRRVRRRDAFHLVACLWHSSMLERTESKTKPSDFFESHVQHTSCMLTLAQFGVKHCATVTGNFSRTCRVANNEPKDSMKSFHGDACLTKSHDNSLDKLDVVLGVFEIKHLLCSHPTASPEGALSEQKYKVEQIWTLVWTRSQTPGPVVRHLQHHTHVTLVKPTLCAS